jgi:hypothetical protein
LAPSHNDSHAHCFVQPRSDLKGGAMRIRMQLLIASAASLAMLIGMFVHR